MNKSVVLHIDTSDMDTAKVAVVVGGERFEKTSQSRLLRSQMVLPLIETLLHEHTLKLSDVTAIMVMAGPGSFTGLRVGVAIANTLGSLLGVSVNGKRAIVTPVY